MEYTVFYTDSAQFLELFSLTSTQKTYPKYLSVCLLFRYTSVLSPAYLHYGGVRFLTTVDDLRPPLPLV